MATTSGNGSNPIAKKPHAMAKEPIRPRHTCPIGFTALSELGNTPRQISQIVNTGIAKKERKNTASPAGMSWDVALIKPNIETNTTTDRTLRVMPRIGFNGMRSLNYKHDLKINSLASLEVKQRP